jgi:hypothetical protein
MEVFIKFIDMAITAAVTATIAMTIVVIYFNYVNFSRSTMVIK